MKKYDYRHIAFHVLIALYFIWLPVISALLAMALSNAYNVHNVKLDKIFMTWIFLNMIMGSAMFIVLQMFKNRGLVNRVVQITYIVMAAASVTTVLLMMSKK